MKIGKDVLRARFLLVSRTLSAFRALRASSTPLLMRMPL
jgi:hypothetical protein